MRRLAEDLLFEARVFTPRRKSIPPVAPDLAGLATQLGQAMAALESFEGAKTLWDETLKCFVWWARSAVPVPVRRLKPKVGRHQSLTQTARMAELREKLARRIDGDKKMRYDMAYADGFRAAQAQAAEAAEALPPEPRITPASPTMPAQAHDGTALCQTNPRLHFRE